MAWTLSDNARKTCRIFDVAPDEVDDLLSQPASVTRERSEPDFATYFKGDFAAYVDTERRLVISVFRPGAQKDLRRFREVIPEKPAPARRQSSPRRRGKRIHPAVAALGNALKGVRPDIRKTIEDQIAARGYGNVVVHSKTKVDIVD